MSTNETMKQAEEQREIKLMLENERGRTHERKRKKKRGNDSAGLIDCFNVEKFWMRRSN